MRTLARHDALSAFEPVRAHATIRIALWLLGRPLVAEARSRRPGEKLAAAFQALGPSFVKLGQALSVRSDLVGEELAADLAQLQDRLPSERPARRTTRRTGLRAEKCSRFTDRAIAGLHRPVHRE